MNKLMVLTLDELAAYIVEQLDMTRVLLNPFPACDFSVVELEADENRFELTNEKLEELHTDVCDWYGLKAFRTGFDDIDLCVAADYYGGGCTAFFQLHDGMDQAEAKKTVHAALYSCLEHNECIDSETLLIVERLEV